MYSNTYEYEYILPRPAEETEECLEVTEEACEEDERCEKDSE